MSVSWHKSKGYYYFGILLFCDFLNGGKKDILPLISVALSYFKLEFLLFLIIYPYKLPRLTLNPNFLLYICESALKNGVKVTNKAVIIFTPI